MFNVSVLTIGDEICIGQIVNTNAAWISAELTKIGANVLSHSVVGDDRELMLNEINRVMSLCDFLIITGGLGPTHDDITKPVLCELFSDELIINQEIRTELIERYGGRDIPLLQRNLDQALVPSKAEALTNRVGSAPGLLFRQNNKYIVALPGVPKEMISIMNEHVLPYISKLMNERKDNVAVFKTLQTAGIGESVLAEMLGEPDSFLDGATLAFLPSYKGVRLRIGVKAESRQVAYEKINKIENYIRSKAEKYIYATGEVNISEAVAELLLKNGKTVSVAESCTGGMLGAEFTELPGSSAYFMGGVIAYDNFIKTSLLKVKQETLDNFGAVSEECCKEMALNARTLFQTDYAVSITGIAGPDGGTPEKPVGTVWIGLADNDGVKAKVYKFGADRKINRERAVGTAMNMLLTKLKGLA